MPIAALTDVDLYYAAAGTGPPLLLIHGTQPDADVWGPAFDALAQEQHVIAYDRRGFSRSKHAPEPDYRVHARDAAALLEHLGSVPAAVLGWSWGGLVALELAAQRPDIVSELVLVEPAVHLKRHPTVGVVLAVLRAQLLRRIRGDAAASEAFLGWACRPPNRRHNPHPYGEHVHEAIERDAHAIVAEIDAGTGEDLSPARIASICRPATIILSELSDTAFRQAGQRIARVLPKCTVVRIPSAGHMVHLDQPAAFVEAVRSAQRQVA